MEMSPDIKEIAAALSKAQSKIEAASKDKINPHLKSKYADLASIWEAIKGPFAENGLSVVQCPENEGSAIRLTTLVLHISGQWIKSSLVLQPTKGDPQGMGSAITYAKRYALSAMSGAYSDIEDDDGNEASAPRNSQPKNQTTAQTEAPEPQKWTSGNEVHVKYLQNIVKENYPIVAPYCEGKVFAEVQSTIEKFMRGEPL